MQCPICKGYRHTGDCEQFLDEMEHLELLRMDAEQSRDRYEDAVRGTTKEYSHERSR